MTSQPWFPAKRAPTLGSKTLTGASGGTPGEEDQTTSMAVTAETAETSEGEEGLAEKVGIIIHIRINFTPNDIIYLRCS